MRREIDPPLTRTLNIYSPRLESFKKILGLPMLSKKFLSLCAENWVKGIIRAIVVRTACRTQDENSKK